MAEVILVTGGSRSGKSTYALRLAEALPGPRAFIATCPAVDAELTERIREHRRLRRPSLWQATIEEQTDLAGALRGAEDYPVILVDCLTLWINNLLHEARQNGRDLTESGITKLSLELLATCANIRGTVIFVTNEVGMGIVPDNAISRLYRDLAGRCNQEMAAGADTVTLLACGLPLELKRKDAS